MNHARFAIALWALLAVSAAAAVLICCGSSTAGETSPSAGAGETSPTAEAEETSPAEIAGETSPVQAADQASAASGMPWWFWAVVLFAVTFVMGVLAVLGGVGGGVLFVPIVGGFFPFHLDFVRGAGLLVALSGALAAGPGLLKRNLASLRLTVPVALIASTSAIIGARLGLALPDRWVQVFLGVTILAICVLMMLARKSERPEVRSQDRLSLALQLSGIYWEQSKDEEVDWKVHRTPQALALFVLVGLLAGMFGLGAGWANVPVLNLVMGAPLKISVATSKFLLSITDTSAAWIYLNRGCVVPLIVVPSVLGIMLGSFVGVRILAIARPAAVRWIVIAVLAFAGLKALHKGITLMAGGAGPSDPPAKHAVLQEENPSVSLRAEPGEAGRSEAISENETE